MQKLTRIGLLSVGIISIPLALWQIIGDHEAQEQGSELTNDSFGIKESVAASSPTPTQSTRSLLDANAQAPLAMPQPSQEELAGSQLDGRELDLSAFDSAEQMLSSYWGSQWPAVQAELAEAGMNLDKYPFEDLKEWDAVRLQVIDHVLEKITKRRQEFDSSMAGWDNLDAVIAKYTADGSWEGDREQVWSTISDYNWRIQNLAKNYHSGLEHNLLDMIDSPENCPVHPIVFPNKTLGSKSLKPKDYAYIGSFAVDGWSLNLKLHRDEHPQLYSWMDELNQLYDLRKEYATAVLGS